MSAVNPGVASATHIVGAVSPTSSLFIRTPCTGTAEGITSATRSARIYIGKYQLQLQQEQAQQGAIDGVTSPRSILLPPSHDEDTGLERTKSALLSLPQFITEIESEED